MHACNDRAMSRVQDLLPPFLANSTGYGRPPQSYGRASPSFCFLDPNTVRGEKKEVVLLCE